MRKNKAKFRSLMIICILCSTIIISQINDNYNIKDNNVDKLIDEQRRFVHASNGPLNSNYFNYYKTIDIDHTKVNGTSNLLNFPVLISVLDSDLHNDVQGNGNDIRFANETDWLNHEIEVFNQSYDSNFAQLIAWVRIPSLSPTQNTTIYMYYGNSTMEAQENSKSVWDTNYVMVQHLNEKSGIHYDSTYNYNNGTASGGFDQDANGKIDGAVDFDGINGHIGIGDSSSLNITEAITIEAWIEDDIVGKRRVVTKGNEIYVLRTNWSGQLHGYIKKGGTLYHVTGPEGLLNSGIYHHIALTWDGGSGDNKLRLFHNGLEVSSYETQDSVTSPIDTSDDSLFIGSHGSGEWWDGRIDEVRISAIKRSADWIATEFNNQNDPNSFYSIGKEQVGPKAPLNKQFFKYYKTIIIDHTKINGTSNLINFPVLISILDTDLKNDVQGNGNDIKFANETNWLDHEIEIFNQSYNDTYAQLVAWVRIPSLSPITDTIIYMYYGNSTMGPQENPSGVWDDNYEFVLHMNQDPSSSNILDSTSNSFDFNVEALGNMTSDDLVNGQTGKALSFDGIDDYIYLPLSESFSGPIDKMMFEFWIMLPNGGPSLRDGLAHPATTNGEPHLYFYKQFTYEIETSSTIYIDSRRDFRSAIGSWEHIVAIWDGTGAGRHEIYVNGSLNNYDSTPLTGTHVSWNTLSLCTEDDPSDGPGGDTIDNGERCLNAILSEFRLSNVIRSEDWIATEYNNQFDPYSFYTIGSEELVSKIPPNADYFNYYKAITIDHTKVNGSSYLYDFPMLISIYDKDLHDDVQPTGNDIAFAKDSNWLNHEIEFFNRDYNKTHAELIAWVRIPSLSPNTNINITMYYGNSTMGVTENPTGVWTSNYRGIWHLKEDPSEPAPQFLDSTSNSNDGFARNLTSTHQKTGIIDGSLSIEDNDNSYERHVNISHSINLQLSTDIIVSVWVKTTKEDSEIEIILAKWGEALGDRNYWLGKLSSTEIVFYVNNQSENVITDLTHINDGEWHYIVGVADASSNFLKIFIDGIERSSSAYSGSSEAGDSNLHIGNSPEIENQEWQGSIDEVRVSDNPRSAGWIATEYNNQKDPNNFYIVGNESVIIKHPPNANYFQYYKILQINHTKVNGTSALNNFPLLISLLDSDLHVYVQSSGNDIKFAMDGSWLDHEIELFNKNYDSSHAQLISWVRIPSLSPLIDSLIFMYYGNATMISQEDPENVWYSSYKGVWHLSESPSDPSPQFEDKTSNYNDGTACGGLTSGDQVAGQIDGSIDFDDGTDDYISMGTSIDIASSSFSVSTWAKRGSSSSADIIFQQGPPGQYTGFHAGFRINNSFTFAFWADDVDTTQVYTDTDWHHWSCTYDDSTKARKIYRDGVNIASDTAHNDFLGSGEFFLGYDGMVDEGFDGQLDESRLLNIALSSEWIMTEYNNQYDPSSFYVLTKAFLVSIDTEKPIIIINSPSPNELFSHNPPAYNISIFDFSSIDSIWYSLDGGTTNSTPISETGNINQTLWDAKGNGTVIIRFYANDTRGNLNYAEVIVRKDIILPYIEITNPSPDGAQVGGDTISISGMANGTGSNIISIYINDTRWDLLTDPSGLKSGAFLFNNNIGISPGFYWIEINITDAAGNVNSSARYFQVVPTDITPPILQITSISPNPTNGFTNITITSNENLKSVPLLNITLPNGSLVHRPMRLISPLTWRANYTVDADGIYTIRINGTDNADNVGYTIDTFEGDVTVPSIFINTPNTNDIFGKNPPKYNLTIVDAHLHSIWYSLNGGITNSSPVSATGTISLTLWDDQGNGTVTILFYANDTTGNVNYLDITIRKDIYAPSIEIISPTNYELFGEASPEILINLNEPNLDKIWYQLNNMSTTTDNYTWTGSISQSVWDEIGNGTVIIRLYANDTVSNFNSTEIIIYKDITIPDLFIIAPNPNYAFNHIAPSFTISVIGSNLDERWYTLNNGATNYTFTGLNGIINQSAWDIQEDGLVRLKFYLRNKLGLVGFDEIIAIKDTIIPSVSINLPLNNSYCGTPPLINVIAYDSNLDTIWYRVDSFDVILENNLNQQLESSIWGNLSEDWFNVYIYANDSVGHVNNVHVLRLCKDITVPSPPILITFPEGDVKLPLIFDWEDGTDFSGISYYRLIIDNEVDPYTTPGFVFEVNITNLGPDSSFYRLEEDLEPGEYYYFLYQVDGANHQSTSFSGRFTIGEAKGSSPEFPSWIIIILVGAIVGLAIAIVAVKRTKKEKVKILVIDKKLEKLKENRDHLEIEAKSALKANDYGKAIGLYEECAKISYKLYEEGDKLEQSKYKYYKDLELEARSKAEAIPVRNACINKVLTKFFDENEIKYYSDPQIYPDSQETINGLILNDNRLLEHRLTNFEDGSDLADELKINPQNMDNINAIQILYTKNLNEDTIVEYCQKYQNPEMMLFIVGVEWFAYHYDDTLTLPQDKNINYPENIKTINLNLFFRIFQITNEYQKEFNKIIDLKDDLEALKKLYESNKITLHDITELKDELKQKGWFFLI